MLAFEPPLCVYNYAAFLNYADAREGSMGDLEEKLFRKILREK